MSFVGFLGCFAEDGELFALSKRFYVNFAELFRDLEGDLVKVDCSSCFYGILFSKVTKCSVLKTKISPLSVFNKITGLLSQPALFKIVLVQCRYPYFILLSHFLFVT